MKIYSYNPGSASAKALAAALGIKRIKHEGEARYFDKDVVINWGASQIRRIKACKKLLNHPDAIAKATNKLTTFKLLEGKVSIPKFTTSREDAHNWFMGQETVVARTKLTGHSGEGIVILEGDKPDVDFVNAPLYTKYIPKKEEYRIHVFGEEAFFIQRKARKLDVAQEDVNWKVRNLAGGFIFANVGVDVADAAKIEAVNAVKALGLDFGAVDIILGTDKKWYVLEVNTACGLEGTTLDKYVEQFKKYL